ncbi:hypothetical protein [Sphingomonas sp. 28-63-12]|uniref:hypothetical protein n=1 Tax=Sphingomonas sp. 28-63-12 TaxID=1970434 RepID=UPI000BDB1D54|nr:MAG: hypothetical protein B7Y47_16085 [Sphingomonas sp. 28-63-12]
MFTMLLFAAALHLPANCKPFAGLEKIADSSTRWVILGEQHGTAESPEAFATLVCWLSAQRGVAVALELPVKEQGAIDAYMISDGGSKARAALTSGTIWQSPVQDGRSSEAYVALLERLRELKRSGRQIRVLAISPEWKGSSNQRERDIAALLQANGSEQNVLVMALVGNVHARRATTVAGATFPTYLPAKSARTFDIAPEGGAQWACAMAPGSRTPTCGPRPLESDRLKMSAGVVLEDGASGFDGIVYLGKKSTASPPAVRKD